MTRIVVVTDHALLRYLERVVGIDVEELRRVITARVDRGAQLGACGVSVDGHTFVLSQGIGRVAVTTVIPRPSALCLRGDSEP